MNADRALIAERIQARKRQAVERGLLDAVWAIFAETDPADALIWAHGDLEIVDSGAGVIAVHYLGRPVLRAGGLEPESVYLYLPDPRWEVPLRTWAGAAHYARASRLARAAAKRELEWTHGLEDRWALGADGSDLTMGVPS